MMCFGGRRGDSPRRVFAYRYDAVGRIVSRTHDLGGASFDRTYAYDDMDRLATDGDAAYSYDAAELRAVRYRFQGRERSAATGLTNFRMRWYDAITGRWLSKDPIGLSGGLNLYAFCRCNPIGNVDGFGTLDLPTVIQNLGTINRILIPGLGGLWVLHHHVRQGLNDPLPSTPPADGKDGWHLLPPEQSVFHDNGDDAPECKFVNDDGREAVYDGASGQLITDDRYLGTYNFINPQTSKAGHFFVDVLPYLIMGN